MYEPLVAARGISRAFAAAAGGTRPVLDAVDCFVFPADRVAVVGPSGSGKSTLLSILGGIDQPTAGQVSWPAFTAHPQDQAGAATEHGLAAGGSPAVHPSPRQLGFVFQSESLLPALTVLENVCLPLMLIGETSGMEQRGRRMLEALDLGPLAGKLPGELSGGQAQRAAVARALVPDPALILADEPTGQLDHPTAQHVLDVILDAISDRDAAVVIATHDEAIAARMTQRWILDQGRLLESEGKAVACP